MGCQPSEAAQVDVGVMARDIDVGVVDDDVLPPPQVRAAPDQLQRHRHQLVDPGPARIGLMTAVVLDVEPDPRRREPEKNSQEHALPPGLGNEDQEPIRHGEAGKEDGRLHVHLPAVTLPTAGGEKEGVDASPQLELEGGVICKFQALGGFHGRAPLQRPFQPLHEDSPALLTAEPPRANHEFLAACFAFVIATLPRARWVARDAVSTQ